ETLIQIQGRGCGPGVIGIGIGGDRASGMALAQKQLFRPINDRASVKVVSQLEKQLLEDANSLGIGPLGLGGKSTLLAVKVASESSPRESCYVSIAFLGWTYRRQGVSLDAKGNIDKWLYPVVSEYKMPAGPAKVAKKKPADSGTGHRPRSAREALLADARAKSIRKVDSVEKAPAKSKAKAKKTAAKKKSTPAPKPAKKATVSKTSPKKTATKKTTASKSTGKSASTASAKKAKKATKKRTSKKS
ncbi:MAG: fumarate hydratase, partial [Planctomycetota bacterium]